MKAISKYLVVVYILIILLLSGCGADKPMVHRVGVMYALESQIGIVDGFKAEMAELGYVEGENIVYDMQRSGNNPETERQIIEKFVADKVDLMFVSPTGGVKVAKTAAQGAIIPIVFTFSTIEGTDLVESIRNPGGNITGVRYPLPEVTAQRFDFLYRMAPHIKRLWLAYDPDYPTTKLALEALRPVAAAKGVTLVEVPAKIEDVPADLATRSASDDIGLDAMLIMPEPSSQSAVGFAAIRKFAAEHKVPIAGSVPVQAEQGALFGFAPDLSDFGKLAAPLVDKIFKGVPAGSIPVVTPNSHLIINYKVSQELGLTVPKGLLAMANKIIK